MSELKKLFGKRIAKLRNNLGLTQMQLAEKLEMSSSAIAEIETGITFPKTDTIEKLRKVFGCEYMDLFNFYNKETVDSAYLDILKSVEYLYKNNPDFIPAAQSFLRLLKK